MSNRTVAVMLLRDSLGRVLLQFRDSRAPVDALRWSLFGGEVEPGENSDTAVLRETNEELGISLQYDQLIRIADFAKKGLGGEKSAVIYTSTRTVAWGDFRVHEGAGAGFFTLKEIENLPNVTVFAKEAVKLLQK